MNSTGQVSPHLPITVSKISRNRREDFFLALSSHLLAVKAVARSQSSKLFEAISNGICDGRFPGSSFAVEPQYACRVIFGVVDPSSDFVQDFVTGTLQTKFPRIQPRAPRPRRMVYCSGPSPRLQHVYQRRHEQPQSEKALP